MANQNLTAKEALKRFLEWNTDYNSIQKITAVQKEEDFIQQTADKYLGGDRRQARLIYRAAEDIKTKALLLWANLADMGGPTTTQHPLFSGLAKLPDDFLNKQKDIPGYDRLFGSLDYVDCDHCRSILSPAAYLVDLLRFIQTHITEKNTVKTLDSCKLEDRRPDLFDLPLTCDNAYTEFPYIDIVNEILESVIGEANKSAYEMLAGKRFPMNLPFHLPWLQTRRYLEQFNVDWPAIYKAFAPNPEADATQHHINREVLGLSPEDYDRIVKVQPSWADLSAYYGLGAEIENVRTLEKVETFLDRTGLDRKQLQSLIYQDLSSEEVRAGLTRRFFINNVGDGIADLAIVQDTSDAKNPYERLVGLSLPKLDRIYRFLKLSRKLNWSFADLDWALQSMAQPPSNGAEGPTIDRETALKFDGINDYVVAKNVTNLKLTSFTLEAWVNPAQAKKNVILSKGDFPTGVTFKSHFLFWIEADNKLAFHTGSTQIPARVPNSAARSDQPLPLNAFSHVAVTVNNTEVKLYINGILSKTAPSPGVTAAGTDLYIGQGFPEWGCFAGIIKDVRIWHGARSQAVIAANRYHRLTGRENHLVGYWPLTENRWQQLFDRTPNRNDGVMGGEEFVTQPQWVERDLVLDAIPDPLAPKGYQFNGTDQYLATRSFKGLDGDLSALTLEAWIKIPAHQNDNVILCKGNKQGGENQFLLMVDGSGQLFFKSSSGSLSEKASTSIPPNTLTHVCVTFSLEEQSPTFYVNGFQAGSSKQKRNRNQAALPKEGTDLFVGRDFDSHYFKGLIQEMRLWNLVRSPDQIAMYQHRTLTGQEPGLVGYWRLDEIKPSGAIAQAMDLSPYQNHLELGGLLSEYQPTWERLTSRLLPASVSVEGTALTLDGDNDVVIITDPKNAGLGKYDQFTLTLWFKATDLNRSRQILYSQGDAEAGLNIYLSSDKLSVLVWKGNYEQTSVQEVKVLVDSIQQNTWNHLAVTINESQLPDNAAVLKVFIDGSAVGTKTFKDYQNGTGTTIRDQAVNQLRLFPLSPVGPAYLGGLGREGVTRFVGQYSQLGGKYYFAGQVADLRLWQGIEAITANYDKRYVALDEAADNLILYLPLTQKTAHQEDKKDCFSDPRSLEQTDRKFGEGYLQPSNLVLVNDGTDAEQENMYSHYTGVGVLEWKDDALLEWNAGRSESWTNYEYTGRLWITDAKAGIGVTFFSHYPNNQERYYQLYRHEGQPQFHLTSSNPGTGLSVTAAPGLQVDPVINAWYRFRIQVKDEGSATTIQAKVWKEGTTEPGAFQISAHDDSPQRLRFGTVGVWTFGSGRKYFDNLEVKQLDDATVLLSEDFQGYAPFQSPSHWKDSGVRIKNLLKVLAVGGQQVLGTVSEIENIHSHYNGPGAMGWTNYCYTGRLYISDGDGGIGVTFLSQYPNGVDRYYRLRRDHTTPTFHLAPHPAGIQTVSGTIDSGVNPAVNTWYCFRIEVQDTGVQTHIQAKVWPAADPEPTDFQIDAYDANPNRITAGTVGVWTGGKGAKYFDGLQVTQRSQPNPPLLNEDFQGYGLNQAPSQWLETRGRNLYEEDASLFRVEDVENNTAQWQDINDYPLLLQPLNRDALRFDGTRQYLATDGVTGLNLEKFTLEAWVHPTQLDKPNPIFSLGTEQSPNFHVGLDTSGNLILSSGSVSKTSTDTVGTSSFTHVAVSWDGATAKFYINGEDKGNHAISGKMQGVYLEIGKKIAAAEYFQGSIKEVRLWSCVLTQPEIARARHERVDPVPAELVGYWPFPEGKGAKTEDVSANDNALRLGGIESARRPTLFDGSLSFPGLPDLLPDYALEFDGDRDVLHLEYAGAQGANEQKRTVEFWFKATAQTPASNQVLYHESKPQPGQTPDGGLNIYIANDGKLHVFLWPNSSEHACHIQSNGSVLDRWHHVAVTIDGSQTSNNFTVYLDGTLLGIESNAVWHGKPSHTIGVGGVVGSTRFEGSGAQIYGAFLKGQVSELRIWNQVRTQDRLYRPVPLDSPGLVYGWQTDRGMENLTQPHVGHQYCYRPGPEATWRQPTWVNLSPDRGLFDASALKLDGHALTYTLPRSFTLADLTVEAWVKPDGLEGGKTLLSNANGDWKIEWVGNKLRVHIQGNDPEDQTFSYGFSCHEWVHIAIVYSVTHKCVNLFVNCKHAHSEPAAYTAASPITIQEVKIKQDQTGSNCFQGLIKELRIWSARRFVGNMARYRFRRLAGTERGLLAYLPLNGDKFGQEKLVSPDLLATSIGEGFWRSGRPVLSFGAVDDEVLVLNDGQTDKGLELAQRRTVEVWFKTDNKSIYQHKQVIYQEGDGTQGLTIYVHDGKLYFGGYDRSDADEGWATWLSTDRIESDRWHHVALVLDGRAEVRPASLYGLLDGKLVDIGAGRQLKGDSGPIALGGTDASGTTASICFHDGSAAAGETHGLQGQVLELRVWDTVRSLEEIASYRYRQLTGEEADLALWWQFDRLALHQDNQTVLDGSGHDRTVQVQHSSQIQTLGSLPRYALPQTPLDKGDLHQLAEIKTLYEGQKLSMDRLCALWYEIKHIGKADNKVLFDQVFNPPEQAEDAWAYGLDRPILWAVTEDTPEARGIRTRLMGALRVSQGDLGVIAAHLSGEGETQIELTIPYLTRMYQIAQRAKLLHLKVKDFLALQQLMPATPASSKTEGIADVRSLSQRAEWMKQTRLEVADLDFLLSDNKNDTIQSHRSYLSYRDSDLYSFADQLRTQAKDFLVQANSFVANEIDESASAAIFQELCQMNVIETFDFLNQVPFKSQFPELFGAVAFTGDRSALAVALAKSMDWQTAAASGIAETLQWLQSFMLGVEELFNTHKTGLPDQPQWRQPFVTLVRTVVQKLQAEHWIDANGLVLEEKPNTDDLTERVTAAVGETADSLLALQKAWEEDQKKGKGKEAKADSPAEVDATPPAAADATPDPDALSALRTALAAGNKQEVERLLSADLVSALRAALKAGAEKKNQLLANLSTVGFIDAEGVIIDDRLSNEKLTSLIPGHKKDDKGKYDTTLLADIRSVLKRQKAIQDSILSTLTKLRHDHQQAIIQGLADFFGTTTDVVTALTAYFQNQSHLAGRSNLSYLGFLKQMLQLQSPTNSNQSQNTQPQSAVPAAVTGYFYRLSKLLKLVECFNLRPDETQALAQHSQGFGIADLMQLSLADLDNLQTYKKLKSAFKNDPDNQLVAQLQEQTWFTQKVQSIVTLQREREAAAGSGADKAALDEQIKTKKGELAQCPEWQTIAKLTTWDEKQLASLVETLDLGQCPTLLSALSRLQSCFELATALGVSPAFLVKLAATEKLDFDFYQTQAAALLEMLRARYGDDQWEQLYKPVRDALAVQRRDALLSLAMETLFLNTHTGRKDANLLYEYFLIDVQMGSEVNTSRIVQGKSSLQLYVERCLMNLEAGVKPSSVPLKQWEWMKNYRVWEANRKVFLYPESYIQPGTRKLKTELFADLEKQLRQNDINEEVAEAAYSKYLEEFTTVANLIIVGSYRHVKYIADPNNAKQKKPDGSTLYLIGRTDKQPTTYYYRELLDDTRWRPWKKIDVAINAEFATPVFAFGRLFLFWVEFDKITEQRDREPVSEDLYWRLWMGRFLCMWDKWMAEHDKDGHEKSMTQEERKSLKTFFQRRVKALADSTDEVNEKEIEDFFEGRKGLDGERYFLTNDGLSDRVQVDVDVYQPVIKYSFSSFSQNWAKPQTYLKLEDTKLEEDRYIRPEWQRVYAQQTANIAPPSPTGTNQTRIETNVKVLEIDTNTSCSKQVSLANTSLLTWSFWVKFNSKNIPADKFSTADKPKRQLPIPLLSYGTDEFKLVATNCIEAMPVNVAVDKIVKLKLGTITKTNTQPTKATLINKLKTAQNTKTTDNIQRLTEAITELDTVVKAHSSTPKLSETLQNAKLTVEAMKVAVKKAEALSDSWTSVYTAKTEVAQSQANASSRINKAAHSAKTQMEKVQAKAQTWQNLSTVSDAVSAALTSIKKVNTSQKTVSDENGQKQLIVDLVAMLADVETVAAAVLKALAELVKACEQWQNTKKVAIEYQFQGQQATSLMELTYDNNWYHLALTMQYASGKYTVTLYQDGASKTSHEATVSQLSNKQKLAVGEGVTQAALDVFTVQLSEFRFWDKVRQTSEILNDKSKRLTGAEDKLQLYFPFNRLQSGLVMKLVQPSPMLAFTLPPAPPQVDVNDAERVLIFYGDRIRSWRSNREDKEFKLTLSTANQSKTYYDIDLSPPGGTGNSATSKLFLMSTNELSMYDYREDDKSTLSRFQPEHLEKLIEKVDEIGDHKPSLKQLKASVDEWRRAAPNDPLLGKVSRFESFILDINNQPGWYILNSGDEQFLIQPTNDNGDKVALKATDQQLTFAYQSKTQASQPQPVTLTIGTESALEHSQIGSRKFKFTRLSTFAVQALSVRLFAGGLDALLSLDSQTTKELDFQTQYQPTAKVTPPQKFPGLPGDADADRIDFEGAYGLYYWEIFFHIPFLIANRLSDNQRFKEAQKWYHYIFNPLADDPNAAGSHDKSHYWRFQPFRKEPQEHLAAMLKNKNALKEYQENPIDAHAIARLRINAYRKAIVMKYIKNLLDWGDYLFRQDNRESINEAVMLYVLAYNLLGPKPKVKEVKSFATVGSYHDILKAHGDSVAQLTDFLIDTAGPQQQSNGAVTPHSDMVTSFCVVENEKFLQYWDLVEDRLYKIRHSLNIEGVFRQLALFQPPIDIDALMQAMAGGMSLSGALAESNRPVPHYRCGVLLEKAKAMLGNVMSLGSALLSALERRDAEELAAIENTHQETLLSLTTDLKRLQRDEAKESINDLKITKQNIENRKKYYDQLANGGVGFLSLSDEETAELTLIGVAEATKLVASTLKVIKGAVGAVPQMYVGGAGFGASPVAVAEMGGAQASSVVGAAADMALVVADALHAAASMTAKIGDYKRRKHDWEFQLQTADYDLKGVEKQLEIAQIRLQMAEQELTIHEKTIEQNQEIADFYRDKFSNYDLYDWMVGQLSTLYFQAYKMAYDLAKSAEKALQYELGIDSTCISFGHWNSLKKGLLAGESLVLELSRMEKAHLEQNKRTFEIEKTISLRQLDPRAFLDLKHKGSCQFSLTEALFDLDFPGHYCRQIKSLSLSIPAVVGPYQNINATLTQDVNRVLIRPNPTALEYLLTGEGDEPDASVLRTNWRANQQIAISRGVNDSGLFQLNFEDERYLPFEGTGVVSHWRLDLPKASNPIDFESISDVIINLSYTALQGGSTLSQVVTEKLTVLKGKRIFSLAQEFSTAWCPFMNPASDATEQTLSFTLAANMFPMNLKSYKIPNTEGSLYIQLVLAADARTDGILPTLTLKDEDGNSLGTFALTKVNGDVIVAPIAEFSGADDFIGKTFSLAVAKGNGGDALRDQDGFLDPKQVTNIALVVDYEGEIDWPNS